MAKNRQPKPKAAAADRATTSAGPTAGPTAGSVAGDSPTTAGMPAVWVRVLVGVAVSWHVFVVFISPLSVPPTSQLVADLAQSVGVRWYTDPLYLNHGYHFFGPEPPINHLVRYRVTDSGGALIAEGEFPDKEDQRPRLFYHRHMMLSDQAALGPPDVEPDAWLRLSLRAYGRELLRRHNGDRVRVDYVRHALLYPSQAERGDDPNDPGMFTTVVTLDESAAELDTPLPVPPLPSGGGPQYEALPSGGAPAGGTS